MIDISGHNTSSLQMARELSPLKTVVTSPILSATNVESQELKKCEKYSRVFLDKNKCAKLFFLFFQRGR